MIQAERIQALNTSEVNPDGEYVLYWMQQSQRTRWNHALEWAIERANQWQRPVQTVFALTDSFPDANRRHYAFMLEGLAEVAEALDRRKIGFSLQIGNPPEIVGTLAANACEVVVDRGYLRIQQRWRQQVARQVSIQMTQVETDTVVPVEAASDHEEYAARTLRPRIHRGLADYVKPLRSRSAQYPADKLHVFSENLSDRSALLKRLRPDPSVEPSSVYTGGMKAARRYLQQFLKHRLVSYDERSNDPSLDHVSHMSPYLHFGQVSPLEIVLRVMAAEVPDAAKDAYLEQLIIRRELSMNFVHFNPAYDQYRSVPEWARKSLAKHARDKRPILYRAEQLEAAETHDPYWNAAQHQMVTTGKMHNYMRMYWGKKILEWSPLPEQAFETALELNNRYELDGRDANGFTGVAWCFGKHDRPWTERPIFGQVRYMNAKGLERKFRIKEYAERWNQP
jgi:deoxyribodipyrimidine photo-lyase